MDGKKTLEEQVAAMYHDIREIKSSLLGSDMNPNPGIVETIVDHNKRLEKLENRFDRFFWLCLGLAAGCGGVSGTIIGHFIK